MWDQLKNDAKFFASFRADLKVWSKYHSDPVAFFVGHLVDYIMRYKVETDFYKTLQHFEEENKLKEPYFAIHVRRSDKNTEASFFEVDKYMCEIERFIQVHSHKYAESSFSRPTVFVASDDSAVFSELKAKFPNFTFVFNDTFTNTAGDTVNRYSETGLKSFLFDVYFLSRAKYLVCTFTSNVCRLAYELMVKQRPDTDPVAKSLDMHYYNYFDVQFVQIAIMDNEREHELKFRKGDFLMKTYISATQFDGYTLDGYTVSKQAWMGYSVKFASYKAKDFY